MEGTTLFAPIIETGGAISGDLLALKKRLRQHFHASRAKQRKISKAFSELVLVVSISFIVQKYIAERLSGAIPTTDRELNIHHITKPPKGPPDR